MKGLVVVTHCFKVVHKCCRPMATYSSLSAANYSNVKLVVTPSSALVDQKVDIKLSGLTKNQKVTLQAVLHERTVFTSGGQFVADANGEVCVSKQPSLGGSYKGVESMGLFWSMKPAEEEKKYTRISKRDVETPFIIKLNVLDGHTDFRVPEAESKVIVSTSLERWYKDKSVKRLLIRDGKLRGTLFLPHGKGPFPGLLDMFGSTGGLVETRAALLASHGFVTMALGYFAYDDLTKDLGSIDLNYFLDAADWLSKHPLVQPGGIGIFGVSKGAELGMLLSAYSDKVKAIVSVNGAIAYTFVDIKRGGKLHLKGVPFDASKARMENECFIIRDCYSSNWKESTIPIWLSKAAILCLMGEDDMNWDNQRTKIMYDSMPTEVQERMTLKYYPGAGHLIEPPYTPHFWASFHKIAGLYLIWGGETRQHAVAQEDAWRTALEFLNKQLRPVTSMKHKL